MVLSTYVKLRQGTVVGGEGVLQNGSVYYFFKGIPYAVPPLGVLRFKAPVPLESFSTAEISCTKEGNKSLQRESSTGNIVGSEDCLFLNVYSPQTKSDAILPVIVYIHGGGFVTGSGNSDFYNPLYLIQEDVVVVTVNYRLGVLGFLSFPEANIPGNAGLKDQRLALQWVKENIGYFNGDPNNVTLMGHSAGGVCAHLHVLSKSSRKLFHKAIIQSGLSNTYWAIDDEASKKTKKLAQVIGCHSGDPLKIAEFLQNYPEPSGFLIPFHSGSKLDDLFRGHSSPVTPVIEKDSSEAVVTRAPLESMNDENSIEIPVMMGHTSAEAIVFLPFVEKVEDYNDLRKIMPRDIDLKLEDPRSCEYANALKEFYFKGHNVSTASLSSFNDMLGDIFLVVDTNLAAEIHSRRQHKSTLFFYRFDYDGALNLYKKKVFQANDLKGASHADELFYLFQSRFGSEPWEKGAKTMVRIMCKLWTNFVKYGNPTPDQNDELVDCTWEPVKKIDTADNFTLNAFIIDEHQKMLANPSEEKVAFWTNLRKIYK